MLRVRSDVPWTVNISFPGHVPWESVWPYKRVSKTEFVLNLCSTSAFQGLLPRGLNLFVYVCVCVSGVERGVERSEEWRGAGGAERSED